MENLLTNKTASLTELRDPKKVIEGSGGKPVAILNRNQLAGYFVPAAAVEKLSFEEANTSEVVDLLESRMKSVNSVIDYLKDK
jgi:antitoxin StbD